MNVRLEMLRCIGFQDATVFYKWYCAYCGKELATDIIDSEGECKERNYGTPETS
jgi:hypothetical protein